MNKLLLMCLNFFKTGLLAVGGGLATVPFLKEIAEKHPDWYTVEDLTNMIAVGESTPGPIGINIATYAGFQTAGVIGGILATLFMIAPSFIVIMIIYKAWQKFKDNDKVQATFLGLRPAGIGLILSVCYTVFVSAVIPGGTFNPYLLLMFLVFFAALQIPKIKDIHPIFYILLAAAIGIIFKL